MQHKEPVLFKPEQYTRLAQVLVRTYERGVRHFSLPITWD